MAKLEEVGDFQFKPDRTQDALVTDEMFAHGEFWIHLEQMDTDHWWLGITDNNKKGISLHFFIGENRLRNSEGRCIKPLLVRAEEY